MSTASAASLLGREAPSCGLVLELSERLSICSRQLRQLIAQHGEDLELSETQLALLWACQSSPLRAQNQKELAERLVVSPAHVSGLVEQLRKAGLLVGRRDVHDRRRQQWELTPAGQARLRTVLGRVADWVQQSEPRLELAQLLVQLEPLAAALEELAEGSTNGARTEAVLTVGDAPLRGAA